VDFIVGETFSWLGEALLAVERARKTGLPVMVTICFENKDATMEGTNAADAAKSLLDAGADIVGMNCLRPPQHMLGTDGRNAQGSVWVSGMSAGRLPDSERKA